uniref:Lipocalin n=1 Tax=Schistosoma japonicum TaxID=6182 RepID=C1LGZ5_SCHJA|nr:hypothetical protein [Schistosoma japonicum]CAX73973.1 hypothetical protein [Schistosoma japonicum]
MASRIFTVIFSVIISWILRIETCEKTSYLKPQGYEASGSKYLYLDNVNVTMTLDYLLTFFDDDCRKSISLRPPNEEEKQRGNGYREGVSVCRSWRHTIPGQRRRSEDLFVKF